MKKLAMALVLMCALSAPVFAGDMPTGGWSAPPPPGETQTPPGETSTPPGQTETVAGDTQGPSILTTILLTILTWR